MSRAWQVRASFLMWSVPILYGPSMRPILVDLRLWPVRFDGLQSVRSQNPLREQIRTIRLFCEPFVRVHSSEQFTRDDLLRAILRAQLKPRLDAVRGAGDI